MVKMDETQLFLNDEDVLYLEDSLFKKYGDLKWWPAKTRDEVLIGAILTQNTSWNNVVTAIKKLEDENALTLTKIASMEFTKLAEAIHSSGFYNQKTRRLKAISNEILMKYGKLENMMGKDLNEIRSFLSGLDGIGQETLDSILLYALDYPVFVVDKYTRRLFIRLGFISDSLNDHEIKASVEKNITDFQKLKNFHATIVALSKEYCKSKPECAHCPLNMRCRHYMATISP
jgi:endonuclease-3 related protein